MSKSMQVLKVIILGDTGYWNFNKCGKDFANESICESAV